MSRFAIFLGLLVFMTGMLCGALAEIAEAQRLGGGRSLGSRPSQQRPAQQREVPPSTQQQRQGTQQPQPARPGPGGMFGGMFGGLLMGGLIGSLLFGGMDAFSGLNILDLLIIGGALFLLFRFLRTRGPALRTENAYPAGPDAGLDAAPVHHPRQSASGSGGQSVWQALNGPTPRAARDPGSIPADFDAADFLKGAQAAYIRLQESWNEQNLDDVSQFTTPEVFNEIRRQMRSFPPSGETVIMNVEPELVEVQTLENETVASVLFTVLLRENPDAEATRVKEVWRFSRQAQPDGMWLLDGIQQIN